MKKKDGQPTRVQAATPGQDDIPKIPYGSEDLFIIC